MNDRGKLCFAHHPLGNTKKEHILAVHNSRIKKKRPLRQIITTLIAYGSKQSAQKIFLPQHDSNAYAK